VTAAVKSAVHTTSSVYDAMKSSSFLIRVFFANSYICISCVFRFEGSTGLQIAVRSERLSTQRDCSCSFGCLEKLLLENALEMLIIHTSELQ
jgi:hypothetical protein